MWIFSAIASILYIVIIALSFNLVVDSLVKAYDALMSQDEETKMELEVTKIIEIVMILFVLVVLITSIFYFYFFVYKLSTFKEKVKKLED